jgi:hypothetical protein
MLKPFERLLSVASLMGMPFALFVPWYDLITKMNERDARHALIDERFDRLKDHVSAQCNRLSHEMDSKIRREFFEMHVGQWRKRGGLV